MKKLSTFTDRDRWMVEVRDPATDSDQQQTTAAKAGDRSFEFTIAPIPSGWAWRAETRRGTFGYSGCPWIGPLATWDEARDEAVAFVRRQFRYDDDKAERLLAKLDALTQPDLFGGAA